MNYSNQLILRSSFARLPVCPLKCGGGWWLKKKKFLKGLTICKCEVKVVEVKSWCNFCASWQLHCTMSQVGVFLPSLFFFFCLRFLLPRSLITQWGNEPRCDWHNWLRKTKGLKIKNCAHTHHIWQGTGGGGGGGGVVSEHSGIFLSFFLFEKPWCNFL